MPQNYGALEKVLRVGEGRRLKRLAQQADYVASLEPDFEKLSDAELAGKTAEFRQRLENGEELDDLTFEAFAAALRARCTGGDVDFVDAIVHGPRAFVLCLGRFVDRPKGRVFGYRRLDIYWKSTARLREDALATADYCFRYDTDCHWLTRTVPPLEWKPVRYAVGKTFLGSTNLIRWSRRLEPLLASMRRERLSVLFIPGTSAAKRDLVEQFGEAAVLEPPWNNRLSSLIFLLTSRVRLVIGIDGLGPLPRSLVKEAYKLGIGIVVTATPVAVLGPVFWLDEQLPAQVGLRAVRGGVMALVLITLVLVVLMNVTGSLVAAGRAVLARWSAGRIPT